MHRVRLMAAIELDEEGCVVLVRELGYADAMRSMLQFRRGKATTRMTDVRC
jgi:hypothetical protein